MAKYGTWDLLDKSDTGSYRIGMYFLKVSNDTIQGYSLVDVRDYEPAKFHITQCITIMSNRKRFRCNQCNKLIYVDNWNGANPSYPICDSPVCDKCFSDDYLGQTFDV